MLTYVLMHCTELWRRWFNTRILNLLKIPYTHSGVAASSIAMNKINFKRIITKATMFSNDPIYFPKTLQIKNNGKNLEVDYDNTFVVKPIKGGSSVGVKIIKNGNKFLILMN